MDDVDWIALGSIAGLLTALGTVIMAVAIVVTAFYAKGTLAAAKADSRARTRPVVVAELRRELLARGTTLLVMRNVGASIARNVEVSFDPPAPSRSELESMPMSENMKWVYQRFAQPITTWAPGWTISNVVRSGDQSTFEPMTVTIQYEGPDETHYEDSYALLPDHILNETEAGPSRTAEPVKLEQQKVEALRALVRTVRSF